MNEESNNILGTLIIIAVVCFFFFYRNDTWLGFYYPGGDFTAETIYSPEFEKKEECINWAESTRKSRLEDIRVDPQDLYECGKNCKISDDYKYLKKHDPNYANDNSPTYICKVTFDGGDWRRGDYGE